MQLLDHDPGQDAGHLGRKPEAHHHDEDLEKVATMMAGADFFQRRLAFFALHPDIRFRHRAVEKQEREGQRATEQEGRPPAPLEVLLVRRDPQQEAGNGRNQGEADGEGALQHAADEAAALFRDHLQRQGVVGGVLAAHEDATDEAQQDQQGQ